MIAFQQDIAYSIATIQRHKVQEFFGPLPEDDQRIIDSLLIILECAKAKFRRAKAEADKFRRIHNIIKEVAGRLDVECQEMYLSEEAMLIDGRDPFYLPEGTPWIMALAH